MGTGSGRGGLLHLFLLLSLACQAHSTPSPTTSSQGVPTARPAEHASWCRADVHQTAEAEFGVKGPLSDLNTEFLEAHARARDEQCTELESKRLVLRYSFGLYEARYMGKEVLRTFVVPKAYHPVKDVSHAVFLAALLFAEQPGAVRDQHVARTLDALDAALVQMGDASSPTATLLPASLRARQRRILERTRQAVATFSQGGLGPDARRSYFQSVRGDLIENLRDISAESLRALHAAVETTRRLVSSVNPDAWDSVIVVVGVVHQARAREIGIQYFERLLQEPVGEGARNERRLVVAEQLFQGSEQYGLLATHLVDQAGGVSVFADPLRMQWDVLGDNGAALDALLPR